MSNQTAPPVEELEDDRSAGGTPPADRGRTMALVANSAVLIGYVVMVAIFGALRPDTFFTFSTLQDVLNQSVVPVILACGVTFTLCVGEFDLSFTAIMGLSAALAMTLMANQGFPSLAAVLVALLLALGVGLLVGALVALGGASSFIVTLAISSVLLGFEAMVTDNQNIFSNIPESYSSFASTKVIGFNLPVWVMLAVVLASMILLHATRFGRHVYAIGGNPRAAFLAGVRLRSVRISCFLLLAFLAGIAAIVATSKASSYYPNISGGLLLSSYAAVFLGAAIGRSNRFSIPGSAIGVVWLLTLQTGLTQLNQPGWVSSVIQGLVLATAVLLAARSQKARAA